jgi:ATP-binding cassette subfamily F protein 3
MSLITATNLAKSYEPVTIFSGVNFGLARGARVAIVGPNGIGKSTLLRVLAGEESPSEGSLQFARGLQIGYLRQNARFETERTLWDECLAGVSHLKEQEARLVELERQLAQTPGDADLLELYGGLQARFEHQGGYTYETLIERVLTGLGFSRADHGMPLTKLSGGQRTRALLARLLLENPDVLILDEPTNHLDIAAVEWLESYLREWDGTVLLVSHDRYFMDRTVNNIWEMAPAGFETYRGIYSHYLRQRDERWAERLEFIDTEMARLRRELDYVKKYIAGQNTSQAKGKLRRLSREVRAIESGGFLATKGKDWHEYGSAVKTMKVHEVEARLNALSAPDHRIDRSFKLHIRPKQRSGDLVMRANGVSIGYPDKPLFSIGKLELRRLECAALIGPNGAGKTTFLKTMLGEVPPLSGEVELGASLKVGYFAQAHEELNPKNTLIGEIDSMGAGMLEGQIRGHLGRFMFHGEDHYKKVSVLSGGERGRLALAKLSLLDANVLLLDEPSNHLDIPAQEVLQGVLAEFDGTILMVSHDRYLIDALATQIWFVDAEGARLEVFKGSYSEWKGDVPPGAERTEIRKKNGVSRAKAKPPLAETPKPLPLSKFERSRIEGRVQALEGHILKLETTLEKLGKALADPPDDAGAVLQLSEEYAYTEAELAIALGEWEQLQEKLLN